MSGKNIKKICFIDWSQSTITVMNDSQFYVLFNSNLVISGRWADDNERLYAVGTQFATVKIPLTLNDNINNGY